VKYWILILVIAASLTLGACQTAKDAVGVGTDVHELEGQFDRADRLVAKYADTLPEADAKRLRSAWRRIVTVRNYVEDTEPETIARHPEQFASQYITARSAYSKIRDTVGPHLDNLPAEDQRFVARLDQTALDLDERARRLMEDPDGRRQLLLELLRLGAGLAKALPVVL